jgi:hypothetical protein
MIDVYRESYDSVVVVVVYVLRGSLIARGATIPLGLLRYQSEC